MSPRCPILPGDVSAVARALLQVPAGARAALCAQIFAGASEARAHVDRSRRLHPCWGDGTLNAAARRFALADEPSYDDRAYCRATVMVLDHLSLALHPEGHRLDGGDAPTGADGVDEAHGADGACDPARDPSAGRTATCCPRPARCAGPVRGRADR